LGRPEEEEPLLKPKKPQQKNSNQNPQKPKEDLNNLRESVVVSKITDTNSKKKVETPIPKTENENYERKTSSVLEVAPKKENHSELKKDSVDTSKEIPESVPIGKIYEPFKTPEKIQDDNELSEDFEIEFLLSVNNINGDDPKKPGKLEEINPINLLDPQNIKDLQEFISKFNSLLEGQNNSEELKRLLKVCVGQFNLSHKSSTIWLILKFESDKPFIQVFEKKFEKVENKGIKINIQKNEDSDREHLSSSFRSNHSISPHNEGFITPKGDEGFTTPKGDEHEGFTTPKGDESPKETQN